MPAASTDPSIRSARVGSNGRASSLAKDIFVVAACFQRRLMLHFMRKLAKGALTRIGATKIRKDLANDIEDNMGELQNEKVMILPSPPKV